MTKCNHSNHIIGSKFKKFMLSLPYNELLISKSFGCMKTFKFGIRKNTTHENSKFSLLYKFLYLQMCFICICGDFFSQKSSLLFQRNIVGRHFFWKMYDSHLLRNPSCPTPSLLNRILKYAYYIHI